MCWCLNKNVRDRIMENLDNTLILKEWGSNTISKNIQTTVFQLRTFINRIDWRQSWKKLGIQGEIKILLIWGPHHITTLQGVSQDHHLEIIEKEHLPDCKIDLLRIVVLEVGGTVYREQSPWPTHEERSPYSYQSSPASYNIRDRSPSSSYRRRDRSPSPSYRTRDRLASPNYRRDRSPGHRMRDRSPSPSHRMRDMSTSISSRMRDRSQSASHRMRDGSPSISSRMGDRSPSPSQRMRDMSPSKNYKKIGLLHLPAEKKVHLING